MKAGQTRLLHPVHRNEYSAPTDGRESKIKKLGLKPSTVRDYEKMTKEAVEIEIDKARKENRSPEQRNVIEIADVKNADENKANEVILESKARLGEFS